MGGVCKPKRGQRSTKPKRITVFGSTGHKTTSVLSLGLTGFKKVARSISVNDYLRKNINVFGHFMI